MKMERSIRVVAALAFLVVIALLVGAGSPPRSASRITERFTLPPGQTLTLPVASVGTPVHVMIGLDRFVGASSWTLYQEAPDTIAVVTGVNALGQGSSNAGGVTSHQVGLRTYMSIDTSTGQFLMHFVTEDPIPARLTITQVW
jgi:hypothetical protein